MAFSSAIQSSWQSNFSILDQLRKAAVIAQYWRAVERFGDVGFFDDRVTI